jgi:hypothetical protein
MFGDVMAVDARFVGLGHELEPLLIRLGEVAVVAALEVVEDPESHRHGSPWVRSLFSDSAIDGHNVTWVRIPVRDPLLVG